jgi:hypothetical protein
MSAILSIQSKLKCAKSHNNPFGKFNYRKCEDILESLKPLLIEHGVTMVVSDNCLHFEGGHIVIEATVTCDDGGKLYEARGYAGVEKAGGMSLSQSFGAASSYARKYALNGLFLIDDSVDDDGLKPQIPAKVSQATQPLTESKQDRLLRVIADLDTQDPQVWRDIVLFDDGIHKGKALGVLIGTDEGKSLISYMIKATDRVQHPNAGYILDSAQQATK